VLLALRDDDWVKPNLSSMLMNLFLPHHAVRFVCA